MNNLTDNHTARRIRLSYSAIVATLVLTLAALISFCVTNGNPLSVNSHDMQLVPIVNDTQPTSTHAASPVEKFSR